MKKYMLSWNQNKLIENKKRKECTFEKFKLIFTCCLIIAWICVVSYVAFADQYTNNTYIIGKYVVTDKTTGLMWEIVSRNPMSWKDALKYCEKSKIGGFTDWRLPNIKEFQSIISYWQSYPAINTIAFPDTQSDFYWTSTTDTINRKPNAFAIDFTEGEKGTVPKGWKCWVKAVRGGK